MYKRVLLPTIPFSKLSYLTISGDPQQISKSKTSLLDRVQNTQVLNKISLYKIPSQSFGLKLIPRQYGKRGILLLDYEQITVYVKKSNKTRNFVKLSESEICFIQVVSGKISSQCTVRRCIRNQRNLKIRETWLRTGSKMWENVLGESATH